MVSNHVPPLDWIVQSSGSTSLLAPMGRVNGSDTQRIRWGHAKYAAGHSEDTFECLLPLEKQREKKRREEDKEEEEKEEEKRKNKEREKVDGEELKKGREKP
ncbi:hypothetical protein LWI28_007431 [Acer negundo]|uniref:Uncharacterized protein n=1 Tax=Acer negundo TaxID=4023 RepID=A0AAD5ITQ7_ACENE|nr:hypothetical protein LWI28_007431 [Acer negundo]